MICLTLAPLSSLRRRSSRARTHGKTKLTSLLLPLRVCGGFPSFFRRGDRSSEATGELNQA